MEINDRLKRIIFKKLVKDLSHAEIILYDNSIWFIDRNKKYWYLEFKRTGFLWWRYDFFERFFPAFSLDRIDYEPLIAEWVEDVLNHKVTTTSNQIIIIGEMVEDVLKHKVNTTRNGPGAATDRIEEVLNHKVVATNYRKSAGNIRLKQILNHKVITTYWVRYNNDSKVEQVLNSK
jgi:hypothetical protein